MTTARPLLVALLVLPFLAVAASWAVLELGDVPHYGDTLEYLSLARTLEVDAYRGILYPAFLAAVSACLPAPGLFAPFVPWHTSGPCDVAPGYALVQLLQWLFAAAAWAAYVQVFLLRREPGARGVGPRTAVLVLLLILFDPLVAHFDSSVMTDGLALSGTALFCAALEALRTRRWPTWLAASVLLLAFLATAGLRPEKRHVLVVVAVLTPLVWAWGRRGAAQLLSRKQLLLPAALGLLGFVAATVVQRAFERAPEPAAASGPYAAAPRWPLRTTVLHQRIVFPHLVETYDAMPAEVRRRISPRAAAYFDEHHRHGREVLNAVVPDAAERDRMVAEMAAIAWRRCWPAILLDVLRDTAENVLATPSFYARLGTYAVTDEPGFRRIFYSDGTRWTYLNLELHHPRTSRAYLGLAALLFLLASGVACVRWRRCRARGGARLDRERISHVAPVVLLVCVNAAAFALTQDLVHIRYAVFAHASFLAWVYSESLSGSSPPR